MTPTRPKGTTSFRISNLARWQLARLARYWGMTRSEALSVIIDRAYGTEMAYKEAREAKEGQDVG